MRKGKKNIKRGRKGYKARRGRRIIAKRGVPERASCTEVFAGNILTSNQSYSVYNVSLDTCLRARDIAKGYQFYRIKRITMVLKPTQDTFQQGGNSVPYLYYMIDRTKQFAAGFSTNQLKAMGAKARRVDEKNIEFSYMPSVLTETFDNTVGANTAVQYKMSPWLPCKDTAQVGVWNPNTTDHLGIVWRIEQAFVTGSPSAYTVERRVEFEFKKPAVQTFAAEEGDEPIDLDLVITA